MRISDWSSDVCSSDLKAQRQIDTGHDMRMRGGEAAVDGRKPNLDGCQQHERKRSHSKWQRRHAHLDPAAAGQYARDKEKKDCRRSEEHTSELQSLMRISYAVFCLKKQRNTHTTTLHYAQLK